MSSIENNVDDWRDIRARVDSIANAIFLIAGGALSLSISVILSNKGAAFITGDVQALAAAAWWSLLASIVAGVVLKAFLVFQTFMLQVATAWVNRHLAKLNALGWVIGVVALCTFIYGLVQMVRAAIVAVGI